MEGVAGVAGVAGMAGMAGVAGVQVGVQVDVQVCRWAGAAGQLPAEARSAKWTAGLAPAATQVQAHPGQVSTTLPVYLTLSRYRFRYYVHGRTLHGTP